MWYDVKRRRQIHYSYVVIMSYVTLLRTQPCFEKTWLWEPFGNMSARTVYLIGDTISKSDVVVPPRRIPGFTTQLKTRRKRSITVIFNLRAFDHALSPSRRI